MRAIAERYADSPENTLVVSPDNASRMEINRIIHDELQERGAVSGRGASGKRFLRHART